MARSPAVLALAVIVAAGVGLRLVLAYVLFPGQGHPGDLGLFGLWASSLAAVGPGAFYASTPSANYPPVVPYVLWFVGSVGRVVGGVTGIAAYDVVDGLLKIPPILADAGIAIVLFVAGRRWFSPSVGLIAAALYLFVPVTWYDAALWGQVDAIGTLVLLCALILLIEGWSEPATALTIVAILTKPQYAIGLAILVPVLLRRHLLAVGSGPVPTLGPRLSRVDAALRGLLQRQGPLRLGTSALVGVVTLLVIVMPFDIATFAAPSVAAIPGVGQVAGLIGLFTKVGGGYTVLTANAYNGWALVGDPSLASVMSTPGAPWIPDAMVVVGGLSAALVGGLLLIIVLELVVGGLLIRDGRTTILLGATIVALAFYLLPTRVHERYLFPFFAFGALLAASSLRVGLAYVVVGLLNVVNLHAALVGAPGFGEIPGPVTVVDPDRAGYRPLVLPLADLARNETIVAVVAIGQTAVLIGLLAWWIAIISRRPRDPTAS